MANDHISQLRPIVTRTEAIALGLKRYFTGEPCKVGHLSERRIHRWSCIACDNAYKNKNNRKNPEKNCARAKAWSRKNAEKNRARVLKWQIENRDRKNAYIRQRRANNYDREIARERKWQKENISKYRLYRKNTKYRRRAILKEAGSYNSSDIERIFRAQKGKCAECRASLKGGYQIDHIISLARGGSNLPRNLQLMCSGPCNQQKGARDPIEYARSVGRLL